ncbi:maleylacetate reductase [Paracoccus saliphilus]|uniref:Maleylacetate reductase n=1 Tax=Paracoccus saliphilus TaxID=405559 RepID=A0AA45W663_9RHOB|nr:maleylacetate reductase [Paracoccus saliphilus]WCR01519.1 maleylacetate reductase [Paracoccus saliphilus]SIS99330.1 maleylacetate reductase [Paracoccus saliphilus]
MAVFHAGFDYSGKPVRVRFELGGRKDLSSELDHVGGRRALILTTSQQVTQGEEVAEALGKAAVGLFSKATMHTPVDITEMAMAVLAERSADCLVAVGGGSTIGLSKAISYRTDLPQIVIPTTYAGSEATPVLGQTDHGRKNTLRSQKVQPEVIVYDAELVRDLPVSASVTSGLNAMAHAVEALYAQNANRLSSELALAGLKAFIYGLPRVTASPDDLDAREDTLFGAWLCGSMLDQVGMALHHKLCHTLGGVLNLPHAETHAVILPQATAYNEQAVPDKLAPLAELLEAESAAGGLFDFTRTLGAPTDLNVLGVVERDLDRIAREAVSNPYWNPVPIEKRAVRELLQRAFYGQRPVLGEAK